MPVKAHKPSVGPDSNVPLPLLTAADRLPYIRFGVFGRSGTGKTQLAATACEVEELSPVLYLDCGESSDTLLGEPRFASIEVMRIHNLDELSQVYNWLAPTEWGGGGHIADYKTLVIDEIDELHTQSMRLIMDKAVKEKPNQDRYVPSPREWGIMRSQLLEVFDWLRVLPINLIYVCVPNIKEDSITSREQVTLGMPGKLSDDIAKRLSFLAYLEVTVKRTKEGTGFVETVHRVLKFKPSDRFLTKIRGETRAARLGDELVDPTMPKLMTLLNG